MSKQSNWKTNLLSMERGAHVKDTIEINIKKERQSKIKTIKIQEKELISKRDVKIMLTVREWFRTAKAQEQEKQRALDIKTSEPVIFNPKSLISKILNLFVDKNKPQHITSIITQLETSGYTFKSLYHKYNTVRNTIRNNYFLFVRVGKGIYKLRQGLNTKEQPIITPTNRVQRQRTNTIPKIKDAVIEAAKMYSKEEGIWPGRVCYILNRSGFKCGYSTVHRIMQKEPFIRNGFLYKVL